MFRSATFKLTLYYLVIIGVIVLGFSAVVYQFASSTVSLGLRHQTQRLTQDFPVFSGSPYLRPDTELHDSRDRLLVRLVLCDALVLVGAGFASYALARRTLSPIEAAHESQKRFTADVSHELRTPLTALQMESEVALLDPKATVKELRATLASNVEEAEKLTVLISNLLHLGKLDANDLSLTPTPLNDVMADAVKQLEPIAEQRGITLRTTLGKNVSVLAERSTLTQLFTILLDNALKYSSKDTTITIGSTLRNNLVQVSIADQGIGIPKTDLEHVFERFYRADTARTGGQASGFGIGLSLAKLIADNHGANISLTSQQSKGTTATVAIPVADSASKVPTTP